MKIGIMGGTFNPIHNGHLLIGEYARAELGLDQVIYIPNARPGHKQVAENVSPDHRYEMVRLAIGDNPYFKISDLELNRQGLNYTVDTLRSLKEIYGQAELYFIIGEDSLFNLRSWKDHRELLELASFIVFKRGRRTRQEIEEEMASLAETYGARLAYIEAPVLEISSTNIRKRLRDKKTIKYQVPGQVEDYIYRMNLYGDD